MVVFVHGSQHIPDPDALPEAMLEQTTMNGISGEPLSHAGEDRERGEASWNRRGLFTSLVGALSARAAAAQSPPGVGTARGNRRDEFYYIVNHATFGYTPQEYAMALQLGYDAWLDRQLSPAQIPDLELDQILAGGIIAGCVVGSAAGKYYVAGTMMQ